MTKFEKALKYTAIIATTAVVTLLVSAVIDPYQYKLVTKLIENYYVDDVSGKVIQDGAKRGMLDALGDTHSMFIDDEYGFDSYEEYVIGEYVGIGVTITVNENKKCEISDVFEDSSAKEAGLQKGDVIIKVDGKEVKGSTLNEITSLIKGEEDTTVNVTVLRNGEELDFNIIRKRTSSTTVWTETLANNLGYIRISQFDIDTHEELSMALDKFKGTAGLVIDLRNNPGGIMDVGISCIDNFLDKDSLIVTAKYKDYETEFKAENDMVYKKPIVVLVNGKSASASEIFAGAIKDNERGVLIGQNTYGKGSIQTSFKLKNNQGISLTVGRFYSPNGSKIDKKGVKPDIEIPVDQNSEVDLELKEAEKYLLGE